MTNLRLLAALAVSTMLAAPMAMAQDAATATTTVRLAAASQGGGYDGAMRNLQAQMNRQGDSFDVTVQNLDGSEAIVNALCSGLADFGPAQKDAYRAGGCDLRPVGVYGAEYTQIFFPPGSRYDELSDLDGSHTILVGNIGSGAALTWDTMVSIETGEHGNNSDWSQVAPLYESPDSAEGYAATGEIDAVFIVAKQDHPVVTRLMAAGWEPGWVEDKDVNDLEFNGAPLYNRVSLDYEGFWSSREVYEVQTIYLVSPTFAAENPAAMSFIQRVSRSLNR
jgi:TRAP-type uncharacterized transport system substrate-binding protein